MEEFNTLCLCSKRFPIFFEAGIWREYLWNFLVYPHKSNRAENNAFNKCVGELPTFGVAGRPRIIYSSATKMFTTELGTEKRLVKFLYVLNHSLKGNSVRGLIIEWVAINQELFKPEYSEFRRLMLYKQYHSAIK